MFSVVTIIGREWLCKGSPINILTCKQFVVSKSVNSKVDVLFWVKTSSDNECKPKIYFEVLF